ncbi:MAG: amidohydrolase [Candidatus Cloacimonetes bacterium]|nr:amidohydrolase [Candidatus Cloacimonadota bacterium]
MKTLYYNAKFYTETEHSTPAIAMLVTGDIIEALYFPDDKLPQDARMIDLNGAFAYPGFIDTHTHSFEGGLYASGLDLYPCRTIDEVLQALTSYISDPRHSGLHSIFAWHFDENSIKEKRFPSLKELDRVCGDKNLILRRIDGHSCIVNSFARRQISELENYQGDVLRGTANDRAVYWFHRNTDDEMVLGAYHKAAEIALRGGFTTVHTMIGDAQQDLTHFSFLKSHLAEFPIEYVIYPQSFNLKAALDAGSPRIGGCILADGSIGSHTAALSAPYLDKAGERGNLYQTNEFWKNFISQAHQHNLQVGIHCIGDRAIKQINDIYLELNRADFRDNRHQIIHCELTPLSLLEEIRQAGSVAVMQPAFDAYWGGENGFYASKLGTERARMMNRFATMFKLGIPVTGGSDWYITELDALRGIKAAMNHNTPSERLSISEAVDIYTRKAAWLSHDESLLGILAPGYQADFTLLDSPLDYEPALFPSSIKAVVKKGRTVYAAPDTRV